LEDETPDNIRQCATILELAASAPETENSSDTQTGHADSHHHHHGPFFDTDELTHSVNIVNKCIEDVAQKGIRGYVDGLKAEARHISRHPYGSLKSDVTPHGTANTVITIVVHLANIYFGGWLAGRGGYRERHEAYHEAPELAAQTEAVRGGLPALEQAHAGAVGHAKTLLAVELANVREELADLEFRTAQNESLKGVANGTSIAGWSIAIQGMIGLLAIVAIKGVIDNLKLAPERRDAARDGIEGAVGVINVVLNMVAALSALYLGFKLVESSGPPKKRFRFDRNAASDMQGTGTDDVRQWRRFTHDARKSRQHFYRFYHPMNVAFKVTGHPYVMGRALETALPIVAAAAKKINIPWQAVGIRDAMLMLTGLAMFVATTQLFKGHAKDHRFVEAVNGDSEEWDAHFLRVADGLCAQHASSSQGRRGSSASPVSSVLLHAIDLDGVPVNGERLRAAIFQQEKERYRLDSALLKGMKGNGKNTEKLQALLQASENAAALKAYMRDSLAAQSGPLKLQIGLKEKLFFPVDVHSTQETEEEPGASTEPSEVGARATVDQGKAAAKERQDTAANIALPDGWLRRLELDKRRHLQMQILHSKLSQEGRAATESDVHAFADLRRGMAYDGTTLAEADAYRRLAASLSAKKPKERLRKSQDVLLEIDSRAKKVAGRLQPGSAANVRGLV
jgi:hypothetical protein